MPIVCPISPTEILVLGGTNSSSQVPTKSDYFIFSIKSGKCRNVGEFPFNVATFGFQQSILAPDNHIIAFVEQKVTETKVRSSLVRFSYRKQDEVRVLWRYFDREATSELDLLAKKTNKKTIKQEGETKSPQAKPKDIFSSSLPSKVEMLAHSKN